MKKVSNTYKVPKHSLQSIALETGTEAGRPDEYVRDKHVKVPVWDFVEVLRHWFLEPTLFGNVDNLINKTNPFGKYVVHNPKVSASVRGDSMKRNMGGHEKIGSPSCP